MVICHKRLKNPRTRRGLVTISAVLAVFVGSMTGGSPVYAAGGSYHCGILVYGAIEDKYLQLGAEQRGLGCPTNVESDAANGGRWQAFQGGSIYWTPATGAHEVHGAIRDKWASFGWEWSFLGYPLTDETTTPDGIGRFNHFQGGSIYWTPGTGAHEVHGAIRDKWASLGWERGSLGYPTSDETGGNSFSGRVSYFQHGEIRWLPYDAVISLLAITRLPNKEFIFAWTARRSWDYFNIRWGDPQQFPQCWYGSPYINGAPTLNCWYPNGPDEHQTEVGSGLTGQADVGMDGSASYLLDSIFIKIQGCDGGGFLQPSSCSGWTTYQLPL